MSASLTRPCCGPSPMTSTLLGLRSRCVRVTGPPKTLASRAAPRDAHVGQLDAALLQVDALMSTLLGSKSQCMRVTGPPTTLKLRAAPREAHVGQLDAALLRAVAHDQHVAGLEVAVHDPAGVQVRQARQQLRHQALQRVRLQAVPRAVVAHHLVQVVLRVLERERQAGVLRGC